MPRRHPHLEAWGLLLGGLSTATGLLLFATGRQREAYALGITGAIFGATVGAVRVLGTARELPPGS